MAFAHSAIISRAHSLSLSLSLSLSRARARALSLEREARGAAARNSGRRHAFAQRRSARRARCAARRRTATTTTAAPTRGRTGDATRRPPPGIPKRCTVRLLDASGAERGATPRSAADSTRYAARRGVGAPRAGRGAALADTWCCVSSSVALSSYSVTALVLVILGSTVGFRRSSVCYYYFLLVVQQLTLIAGVSIINSTRYQVPRGKVNVEIE